MKVENTFESFPKSLLAEINLLRKDPQTYASKIRKYIRCFKKEVLTLPGMPPILTIEGSKAFEEASDFLDNLDPVPILKLSPSLNDISSDIMTSLQEVNDLSKLG